MQRRYDPLMSSRDYLEMARQLVGSREFWLDLSSDGFFDHAVHDRYIGYLLNPDNWAHADRPPRVFVDVYLNKSRNLEVRWGSGPRGIFFAEDFDPLMAVNATSGARGSLRPIGELMWIQSFGFVAANACWPSPLTEAEQAILFGYKARIDELVREINEAVDVVGAMTIDFEYEDGAMRGVVLSSTLPNERLREIRQQLGLI